MQRSSHPHLPGKVKRPSRSGATKEAGGSELAYSGAAIGRRVPRRLVKIDEGN
jgi:hypothetical protein